MSDFDLAVIGGGINGVGIARDAAGRGMRVLLAERHDLASATSSASTKLIHGGLRYLEHGAVRLVREALSEREVLLRMAPHLVRPMRFVLPHHAGLRPAWMLRLGLFLYDHIGGRKLLPATRSIDLRHDPLGAPLRAGFTRGFEYSDCWVDDARLVVLNAVDAAEHGAAIRTRTDCVTAERRADHWHLTLESEDRRDEVTARVVVNATGPWVAHVNEAILRIDAPARVRLVKGSHIVVPKLYEHDRAYLFQNADGRVVFAIPYENEFTLIGTTDIDYQGDPANVVATAEEVDYLCRAASDYFRTPVAPAQVVRTYSGVRPLYDDGASKAKDATRDYVLTLDAPEGEAPALIVYGGKITTYRRLAEEALEKLSGFLPGAREPWTHNAPLPGGDLAWDGIAAFTATCGARWPFLSETHARRLVRAYGTRIERVLAPGADHTPIAGGAMTAAELRYLMRHEWAATPEDILWRRSKLGLHLDADAKAELARLMREEGGRRAAE
jgi:glycerol-3-phosphate dehydrogenase